MQVVDHVVQEVLPERQHGELRAVRPPPRPVPLVVGHRVEQGGGLSAASTSSTATTCGSCRSYRSSSAVASWSQFSNSGSSCVEQQVQAGTEDPHHVAHVRAVLERRPRGRRRALAGRRRGAARTTQRGVRSRTVPAMAGPSTSVAVNPHSGHRCDRTQVQSLVSGWISSFVMDGRLVVGLVARARQRATRCPPRHAAGTGRSMRPAAGARTPRDPAVVTRVGPTSRPGSRAR